MLINKIVYIYSKKLENECNRLPTMLNRASIVQDLINSYQLLSNENQITIVESYDANENELKLFHTNNYIEFLKKLNEIEEVNIAVDEEQLQFGLGYDCPILANNYNFIKTIAGGSLTAAKLLSAKKCEIAINCNSAEGFCYVNDIVLAIQKLEQTFNKILYVDLDIHHGDGVEKAFEFSRKVLTLSFHKLTPGFYPGTGSLEDVGSDYGKYYTINVPFLEGICDKSYLKVFNEIFPRIFNTFKPQAIVVQCGSDSLNEDSIGGGNLTLKGLGKCVETVLNCQIPTLFLGGGGYNFANTARLWTYLTSIIIGKELDDDIPDCSEFFTEYGPTYELHIDESLQKDCNSEDYLNNIINTVSSYCKFIK